MSQDNLFEAHNIYKSFGATKALADVSLTIRSGEIHGLIGENGSGKSTLSTIIAGVQKSDSGQMLFKGLDYTVSDSAEAVGKGICILLQEQGTFANMSVAENIFIGSEKMFVKNGVLSVSAMMKAADKVLNEIGVQHIRGSDDCESLSFEDRKLIELARTAYFDPSVFIVDETSTALSRKGRGILYGMMKKRTEQGGAVLFISHDIDEIMEFCDRITVLRDGCFVRTLVKSEYAPSLIKQLMVGREIGEHYYRNDFTPTMEEQVVLDVCHLRSSKIQDISFQLHKGEVLGIGGLTDCGMHELGRLLYGIIPPDSGYVLAFGHHLKGIDCAIAHGIGYLSKNRDDESLMTASTIRDNICLPSLRKLSTGPVLLPSKTLSFANKWADKLNVKMQNVDQYVSDLSGGNKQKVVIAKWLGYNADIFIMDCPTRGIDVGVKAAIYRLIEQLKKDGKAIVMISEELPELIGMSDRVLVIKNGKESAWFDRSPQLSETTIIEYMI